jgi:hypothetical protein
MIAADSHADAAGLIAGMLDGLGVPVLGPPVPSSPVAGPCVIVGGPEITGRGSLGGCRFSFRVTLLVVAGNTLGTDLLAVADGVVEKLIAGGVAVTSSSRTYNPPQTPAGLPAYEFTLE